MWAVTTTKAIDRNYKRRDVTLKTWFLGEKAEAHAPTADCGWRAGSIDRLGEGDESRAGDVRRVDVSCEIPFQVPDRIALSY